MTWLMGTNIRFRGLVNLSQNNTTQRQKPFNLPGIIINRTRTIPIRHD